MSNNPSEKDFLQLIEENKGIIFKICNSYCTDTNNREDLAQEIIYQLWKSVNKYDSNQKFTTWMYRVALNTAISFYRKDKSKASTIAIEEHVIEIEESISTNDKLENDIRLLNKFITQLKELDKALMLLYLEEKSYSEIAEIIGISVTNVATRISRIKEKLKQDFKNINR